MMRDVDSLIEEALGREEREILNRIGEEPGFFGLAFGLFSGKLGWVNILLMIVQAVLFLAGAYAAWMFFTADDTMSQLRWGLPSAVLLILGTMIKMAMWPNIQTDRLMRELKRIELQLARATQRTHQG
jgi:NADH:ubiquinone oxidoreductase subunit H